MNLQQNRGKVTVFNSCLYYNAISETIIQPICPISDGLAYKFVHGIHIHLYVWGFANENKADWL